MDVALLHPSRFIKSQEFLGKDVTFTITAVHLEELEDENNQKVDKGVISLKETNKRWIINRTNSDCMKGMFGRETKDWVGKRVTLFPAPFYNNFTKEHTTAIRVRGSPDLKEATTVTIALPRKKPVQMKMAKTGTNGAPPPMEGDELQAELDAISALIAATAPEACNAAWAGPNGLGRRIDRLPPEEKKAKTNEFKLRRSGATAAPTEPAPPADTEAPPPA